jgi:hypothetical protein
MVQSKQFFHEPGAAFAIACFGKRQKLPHGEIARMRRGDMQKPGFHFGVAEGAEIL